MAEGLAIVSGRWSLLFQLILILYHPTGVEASGKLMLYLRRHLTEVSLVHSAMLRGVLIGHDLDVVFGENLLLLLLLLVLLEEGFVADPSDLTILLLHVGLGLLLLLRLGHLLGSRLIQLLHLEVVVRLALGRAKRLRFLPLRARAGTFALAVVGI